MTPEVIEIYDTFKLTKAEGNIFKTVVQVFKKYCIPRKNKIYEDCNHQSIPEKW